MVDWHGSGARGHVGSWALGRCWVLGVGAIGLMGIGVVGSVTAPMATLLQVQKKVCLLAISCKSCSCPHSIGN